MSFIAATEKDVKLVAEKLLEPLVSDIRSELYHLHAELEEHKKLIRIMREEMQNAIKSSTIESKRASSSVDNMLKKIAKTEKANV